MTHFFKSIGACFMLFLLAMLTMPQHSLAQGSSSENEFPLKALTGFTQTYYYSPGCQERAASIAAMMEDAGVFFQQEISFTPKTILYILAPADWTTFAAKPLHGVYGFPHNIDKVHLAIAAEDNAFWRSFLPTVDQLDPGMQQKVKKAYGKQDGSYSMMPFFDLLALHEMGHSYAAQAGLKMQRNWMGELFVNIMLHTYIAEKKPMLLPALETFPGMVLSKGNDSYKYTSLEDFERLYASLGMGPENYGWYQSRFHSAAKDIYNEGGKEIMKKLWFALKNHQEDLPDNAFTEMLGREVSPFVASVYLNWNR